jgi:enterochelin esterase-like enzyme
LVEYIDHPYATNADRKQRFIGGLSSGGFGAASLALVHSSTFGGFLAFSGYFHTGIPISTSRPLPPAISPDQLAMNPEARSMRVVIGTGLQDGIYTEEAIRYRDQLAAAGFDVEYIEKPGGHGHHLWQELLWQSLPTVKRWSAPPAHSRTGQ